MALKDTTWHDWPALGLEDEDISVVVVPQIGGKIVSLRHKPAGYEWLVSPEQSHPFKQLPYGADYNSNEPGGWDEMFPTIIAGPYPAPAPWQGSAMPDHGELWTVAWRDAGSGGDAIKLATDGVGLPYGLTRTISLGGGTLRLSYALTNRSDRNLHYLWAAHPQFVCEAGARIEFPRDVQEVVNVLPLEWGEQWGPPGTRNAWPVLQRAAAEDLRQDLVGPASMHRGRKFYVPPEMHVAWAGLRQPGGAWLRLEWDPGRLPYCGIWIDEGALNRVSDVAIEPTTGYYDDLRVAYTNGTAAQLQPRATHTWELTVRLGA